MSFIRFIANQLAPLTLLGAVLAYLHPPLFLIFKTSYLWFSAATMFALGVVLDPQELQDTLREPKRIGLGVLAQFTVMPTLGFAAAYLLPVSDELALGFIIVGCAPGAMASNVIVYLAGGGGVFSRADHRGHDARTGPDTCAGETAGWSVFRNRILADVADHCDDCGGATAVGDGLASPIGCAPCCGARTDAGGRGRRHCHHLQLCRGRQSIAYCRARATGAGRCDYGECPGPSCWLVAGATIPF